MIVGHRIAIIGNAGGGKTALARKLGALLDLPVVHVDSVQYQPGWHRTSNEECDRALDGAARTARWIIDGFGNDKVIERRLQLADTVVFVDFPLWRHYWWAARRQWNARKAQRRELPDDCPEFSFAYTWKLARIMWQVHRDYRPWFQQLVEEKQRSGNVVVIRTPQQWAAALNMTLGA